jgi:type 1 glutamine amidotransferase
VNAIHTLILSGQGAHDWRRSTPFVRDLLTATGRFTVDVTEHPDETLQDAARLAAYDLLFCDYKGDDWSEVARRNFEQAVAGGTGLVILHGANNGFVGWVEYEKMAGLLWRKGDGHDTSHGDYHEFPVTLRDRVHPITRGLSDFRIWDELYHRLAHLHHAPYHVLATGFSSLEHGGTGHDEPVMIVLQYGQGRVFHMILGHVWPEQFAPDYQGATMRTFENPAFQQALLRGCEWAATGDVK